MRKQIAVQYLIGVGLALLLFPILEGVQWAFPFMGYHIFTILYATILIFQILFYYFTTNYKFGWTALSFVLNFILWILEQSAFEYIYFNIFYYTDVDNPVFSVIIGGLLWVSNKLLIDKLFNMKQSIHKNPNKLNTKLFPPPPHHRN